MKRIIAFSFLLSLFVIGVVNAYTVEPGDSLSKIGQKIGKTWQEVWNLNPQIQDPNVIYAGDEIQIEEEELGGTLPVAGVTYTLAGSGITASASSVTLQSLKIPQTGYELQDSDFSSTFYVTFEPGNTKRQEIASCTTVTQNADDTATLSGCSRGLLPFSPYTASTTYQFAHAGGTQLIFSDAPQLFNEFTAKSNTETITGPWTYDVYPIVSSSIGNATTSRQLITLGQANAIGSQGAATSSATNAGISEEATVIEMASSTQFDANNPHYISSEYATSTPTYSCDASGTAGALCVPIAKNSGKLSQSWWDTTEALTWSGLLRATGGFISSASSTFTSTVTFAGDVIDLKSLSNSVTSTGEGIDGSTTPQPVAQSTTTGNLYRADSNDSTANNFLGFIKSNAATNTLPQVFTHGIVSGFSGLTPGAPYFLSDTKGSVGTSPGVTAIIPVGRALSSSALLVQPGMKVATGTISHSATAGATEDISVSIGFRPRILQIVHVINSNDGSNYPYRGIAFFQGTKLIEILGIKTDRAATALTSTNLDNYVFTNPEGNTLVSGSVAGSANGSTATYSINSVNTTGFVSRLANSISTGGGATTAATIYFIAYE